MAVNARDAIRRLRHTRTIERRSMRHGT
jgi:hypothetical protein